MPQTNPNAANEEVRWRRSIEKRFKALQITVPTAKDSVTTGPIFDTDSSAWVGDGETEIGQVDCFGTPANDQGTAVEVSGSCAVGLDTTTSTIGGEIAVQVDGGTDIEPGSGPGIYVLAVCQATLGGLLLTVSGTRVIQILSAADTQGLSQHSFAMMFRSTEGQTVHFETRTLAVDPQ
jgi:hypothetical protein